MRGEGAKGQKGDFSGAGVTRVLCELGGDPHRNPAPLKSPFAPSPLRPFPPSSLRPFAPSSLRPFVPSPLRPFAPCTAWLHSVTSNKAL